MDLQIEKLPAGMASAVDGVNQFFIAGLPDFYHVTVIHNFKAETAKVYETGLFRGWFKTEEDALDYCEAVSKGEIDVDEEIRRYEIAIEARRAEEEARRPKPTNFEKITESAEALGEFLKGLPVIDGPWDAEFGRAFCSGCNVVDCGGGKNCPHQEFNYQPLWWLRQEVQA